MKLNLGVIYGGPSTEHEISVISAVQAMNNIDKDKYEVIPIYLSKDSNMYYGDALLNMDTYKNLSNIGKVCKKIFITKRNNEFVLVKDKFPYSTLARIDIMLPVMHGYNTEDGCIAGFLETLGMPYCESDIYASVIGQDKVFQKEILKANNIPVVDYTYFYDYEFIDEPEKIIKKITSVLKYPVIVKPARQGSSIGIKIAKDKNSLISAIEEAINFDDKILVEKVVTNMTELNCSVLGNNGSYEASLIEQVYGADEILSFKDKYMSNGTKRNGSKGMASAGRKVPADIPDKMTKLIEETSIKACYALNTSGVVRIDYLLDKDDNSVYLNELNITPGSLSFYLWDPKGTKYKELLNQIIECGIEKYKKKKKKTTSFETNVLSSFKGSKGVKK